MKSVNLVIFLAITALSASTLSGRGILLRRDDMPSEPAEAENNGSDDTKLVFKKTTETYTQTLEIVQDSCKKGDTETIYSSISTLETSMMTVQEVTQQSNFDSDTAKSYKESVVQIISSYSAIITVLSTYSDVERGCHKSLKNITSYTQSIVNVYVVKYGICLEEEVKSAGSFNAQAFIQLDMELNLKGQTGSSTTVEALATEAPATEAPTNNPNENHVAEGES